MPDMTAGNLLGKSLLVSAHAELAGIVVGAMLLNPSLLILDESTTGLDVLVEAEILRMISKIRDKNKMSVLIISHDKRITDALCNRIYDMKGYSNECSCKSK